MPEMTPDEMKALIAEARNEQSIHAKLAKGYAVGSEQRRWHEEHQDRYGRFADALEALSAHPAECENTGEPIAGPCEHCYGSGDASSLAGYAECVWCGGCGHDCRPAHPAEETEWAEFDADEIREDGTIHEWAEPKDIWDKPLPADELAELRAEGQVYASRRKPEPWRPVPEGSER